MADTDPSSTLAEMSASLTLLEAALEPLLAKPFDQVRDGLDPLQKARLEVMSGYVVHDLIWIYLRTSGVDPNTHPVFLELQRLKGYFDKISRAETPAAARPRTQLDKAAASRFISAAIGPQRARVDPDYTPTAGPSTAEERGEKGVHKRFEDADVDRLLEDRDEQSEDEIQPLPTASSTSQKDKSKKPARPKMDPFAGYDDLSAPAVKSSKKKQKTKVAAHTVPATLPSSGESLDNSVVDDAPAAPPGGLAATPSVSAKTAKKRKRKEDREGKKPRLA